ncbi:ATP-binding protein [uncultured Prevotella sp.]|uniref:AAA family ATPase n=1 Tax=uncultured Prevotella sp. TaxID=159272 RepID=UPI0025881AC5|nr:ATP-binding protein [uncultured Prevotella sp.]
MSMIANPFITTGRVPKELFCDRKEESNKFLKSITNGANVVLMAPRRVGKTQLVYYCFDKPDIRDNYITFFIDILKTSTLQEFTYEFGKTVFNTLATRGQKMQKMAMMTMRSLTGNIGFDPVTALPTFGISIGDIQNPAFSLEEIFRTLEGAGKKCIVAIDEFQQITNYPEKNIEAELRSHIQKLTNTQFIFSGSERHLLEEMFRDSARPFYNSADIQSLEVIEEKKYADFVRHHFLVNGKRIADEAIHYVYETFDGNTYYNQKTMREAFAVTANDTLCTKETTELLVKQMVKEANRHYSEVMSRLALPQKELLYAIAKEHWARQITSGAFIRRHSLKSASSVQSSIKKLLEMGLVSFESGSYYIADQLMGLWLKE